MTSDNSVTTASTGRGWAYGQGVDVRLLDDAPELPKHEPKRNDGGK